MRTGRLVNVLVRRWLVMRHRGPARASLVPVVITWLVSVAPLPARGETPATLTLGVVQTALEQDLAGNRDKIVRFIGQAKAQGCRVVVFPETALYAPPPTPRADRDAAIEAVRRAAAPNGVCVIFCTKYKRDDQDKPSERLLVFDPQGKTPQSYEKLWGDARFNNVPGPFTIDGSAPRRRRFRTRRGPSPRDTGLWSCLQRRNKLLVLGGHSHGRP